MWWYYELCNLSLKGQELTDPMDKDNKYSIDDSLYIARQKKMLSWRKIKNFLLSEFFTTTIKQFEITNFNMQEPVTEEIDKCIQEKLSYR